MKTIKLFFLNSLLIPALGAMAICTGANSKYFSHTLCLIGSIHKNSYEDIAEIMVFDLGLSQAEKNAINSLKKTRVYNVEKTHPDVLNIVHAPQGYSTLGWFAWKPIVIKQALDKYEHVLWLDAGNTVLKSLSPIFKYIKKHGYLICTIGDEKEGGAWKHPVKWGATKYLIKKYHLDDPANSWILDQESTEGSLIGASRNHESYYSYFLPLYQATDDIKNFADDGTPSGLGRHDQTFMSILAYKQGMTVIPQEYTQTNPFKLDEYEIYTTWNPDYVDGRTTIYHSRNDLFRIDNFSKYLKQRHKK